MSLTTPLTSSSCSAAARLGLEIEMPVADAVTGHSRPAYGYFQALSAVKQARGVATLPVQPSPETISISTDTAECGLDNGWNLLETSLHPVSGRHEAFDLIAQRAHAELDDTLAALQTLGATVLNVSQHPACRSDAQWYGRMVADRPIYNELRGYRGWHHWHGIDAKAQNGANTAMPVTQVIQGLNVVLALSAASIALFANSPLQAGHVAGFKENRLTLWPRVFGPARFSGDLKLATFPSRPFRDLADFFFWMFGPGTVSRGLPWSVASDYKSGDVVLLQGQPCLLRFLQSQGWPATSPGSGRQVMLQPNAGHFVYSQIGQFLDARVRYRLQYLPELPELLQAWQRPDGLEALFVRCGADMYLEARAPAAGFADDVLLRQAGGQVAGTVLMAPLALQVGLLSNLQQALELVKDWGWAELGALRRDAMRHALQHDGVRQLCTQVLDVARAGLLPQERGWLAYVSYVLESGLTGADRLLATWEAAGGDTNQRLRAVASAHAALPTGYFLKNTVKSRGTGV